jgi:hypothetical protein
MYVIELHYYHVSISFSHELTVLFCQKTVKKAKKFINGEGMFFPAFLPLAPTINSHHNDESMILYQPHLSVKVNQSMPHKDAYDLISLQILNTAAKTNADRAKASRIWTEFVAPWFGLPLHWFAKEMEDKGRSEQKLYIVQCKYDILSSCLCHSLIIIS